MTVDDGQGTGLSQGSPDPGDPGTDAPDPGPVTTAHAGSAPTTPEPEPDRTEERALEGGDDAETDAAEIRG